MDWEALKEKVKSKVKPKRWSHILGTAETARTLARHHGHEENRAYLAGLCHDYGRDMPAEDLLALAKAWGIEVDFWESKIPAILHAPVGSELVRRELGIDDEKVLKAIAIHSTGDKEMTSLEKIIYLADKIEPNRSYPGVEEIRRLAHKDLNEALLASLDQSLAYVLGQRKLIHPRTVEARNALILHKEL